MILIESTRSADDYEKIKLEASKPVKSRSKILKTKRGKKIPRRYHLVEERLNFLVNKRKETNKFPNPFRKDGVYFTFIQALINLGENKRHDFIEVKKEMKQIMSSKIDNKGRNLWESFSNKKKDNQKSSWDVNTRIEHTGKILQRLNSCHPYGYKLKQLNAAIHIHNGSHNLPAYELKTDFSSPEEVSILNQYKLV